MNEPKRRESPSKSAARSPAPLRSLIVPLDLTPISDRVVRRVARLPLSDNARITLLHVVPDGLPYPDRREAERYAKQAMAEEARQLAESLPKSIHVAPVVKVGAAFKEIAAVASAAKAELVVMGRGGHRAVRDLFLGSTAERVIRQGKLPVLAVRLPARSAYRRPAIALDLDQVAHEVVGLTVRMVAPARPRVSVIHAFLPPYENLAYPSLPPSAVEERRSRCQREAIQALDMLLATSLVKAKLSPDAAPAWKLLVRHGLARTVVPKVVKQTETDLLVLGTHAYSGVAHVFLGTVAGDLLREVACDTLIVPPAKK